MNSRPLSTKNTHYMCKKKVDLLVKVTCDALYNYCIMNIHFIYTCYIEII